MRVMNNQVVSDIRQCPIDGIEERVRTCVVLRPDLLPFHHSIDCFGNVQMWRIRREEEKEKLSLFPHASFFLCLLIPVLRGVVKHYKSVSPDSEGEVIKETDDSVSRHALFCGESLISFFPCNHAKDVKPCNPLRMYENLFSFQLPSVGDVAFRADVALICEVEVYEIFCSMFLKFLQLLFLVNVELQRGLSSWASPYTLISCANADKKRLKVKSLASLPVAAIQATLALLTFCRFCSMARETNSSSEQSITGLRPCPGRVTKPLMPSALKRRLMTGHPRLSFLSVPQLSLLKDLLISEERHGNAYGSNASLRAGTHAPTPDACIGEE